MRNAYELLNQKEADLARVRHQVDSLRIAAALLSDGADANDSTSEPAGAGDDASGEASRAAATGTDGMFSPATPSRPKLWKIFTGGE
jgi:hypothetical protein